MAGEVNSAKISVIVTVLNESEALTGLLESLLAQSLPADEVVVVDGGSSDDTLGVLGRYQERLPLRVIEKPGANISQGRNAAIAAASHDLIASTDAGVVLDPGWLEAITRPLREGVTADVVAGFFRADPHSVFEAALGATTLPLADEIDGDSFLPSSRSVAFRRSAWEQAGGYPEWLDYCEDVVFDQQLKRKVRPFVFAPDAIAWFRPRPDLRSFYRQYYRYARGDGKADLWRRRHAIRYIVYLLVLPSLLNRRNFPLLLLGGYLYLRRPYKRLRVVLGEAASGGSIRVTLRSNLTAIALVPLIRLTGDVAKMIGYPAGVYWRLKQRGTDAPDDRA